MNIKKPLIYWSFISVIVLLSSCKNDIDLDTSLAKKQLSLNAFIDADSTNNQLLVTITDPNHPVSVTNATVQVTINGNTSETINGTADERGYYKLHGKFNAGDLVRIDVTTPDQAYHAYAEEIVPKPIEKITKATCEYVKNVSYVDDYGAQWVDDLHKISLSFMDNAASADYYRLTIGTFQTLKIIQQRGDNTKANYSYFDREPNSDYVSTSDPIIMEGKVLTPDSDLGFSNSGNVPNRYGIFNDLIFSGKECSINVYENLPNNDNSDDVKISVDLQIVVSSYTRSAYYYLKAMNMKESSYYDDNSDLTGPIKLPSNVQGGTGIVGFYTSKAILIHAFGTDHYPGIYRD